jgi:hypothetical protein
VGAAGAVTEKKLADIEIDAGNVGQEVGNRSGNLGKALGQRQVALVAIPA